MIQLHDTSLDIGLDINVDDLEGSCIRGPVMTTQRTLTIPGVIVHKLLNDAGYNIPEDAFVHDVRVDYQLVDEAYSPAA